MTTRPQDDFDNYINAQWKQDNPIPDKYSRFTNFTVLQEKMDKILIEMTKQDNSLINNIYNLYLNQDNRTLKDKISNIVNKINQIDDIETFFRYIFSEIPNGKYYLLHIYHSGTCRNPKFQVPYFSFGGISLPDKSYYTDKKDLRSDYELMINELFEYYNILPINRQNIDKIWDLESNIAQYHYDRAEKRDPLKRYNPCTLSLFHQLTDNKFSYLSDILPQEYHDIVLDNSILPIKLYSIFNSYNIEILKTWLIWQVIKSYVPNSINNDYNIYFNFYGTKLTGTKIPKPLNERAIRFTKNHLVDEYNRIYCSTQNNYVDSKLNIKFPQFVKVLVKTIRNKLNSAKWMSRTTKDLAIHKLDNINLKIIGPTNYENYDIFNKKYNSIFDFIDDFYKWDWEHLEINKKMYKLHNNNKWEMAAVDINAYYHPFYNEIVFPAAILQPPFYSSENTFGQNAGGIGAIICHEISHGFDDKGSKYDSDGYLYNWWLKQDRKNYETIINPLEEYFNSLTYNDKKLNGRLTQGENLADLGGLKCSLAACPNNEEKKKCIIAWAKTWRANIRDECAEQMIMTDPHSLPRFRINGILPHIKEFYELFNVNKSDKMYLDEKLRCELYD